MVPNIKKTFSVAAGTTYRFSADMAYLSSGGGVILPFSTQANLLAGPAAIYDSIKVYKMVSGVPVYMTAVRYGYETNTVPVSIDFTAPSGVSQILIEFVPGNFMSQNYAYYADNLRFSSLGNFSTFYTSNFTAGTIVSQNTDGWSTNWSTSYMNVLTGSPNKLRTSGETPAIERNFTVVPNEIYKFVYTQSENNSVSFVVEQSPNGTSSWSTLMNTTSTNGTHTRTFTPTQGFVRVKYSASAAFSLANATLNMVDVDTVYTVLARGSYRYAFNGMEKDDEVKGRGNSYNFGARLYDSRLGRWLSIDVLNYLQPDQSSYKALLNNPIYWIDKDGNIEIPLKATQVYGPKLERVESNFLVRIKENNKSKYVEKDHFKVGNIREIGHKSQIYEYAFRLTDAAPPKTEAQVKAQSQGMLAKINSGFFKERTIGTSPHIGVDLEASIGTDVYSFGDGVVTEVDYTSSTGNYVVIEYLNGDKVRFMHLSESFVTAGTKVYEGQIFAKSGNSGFRSPGVPYAAHLHIDGANKEGQMINPLERTYGRYTSEEFFGKFQGDFLKLIEDRVIEIEEVIITPMGPNNKQEQECVPCQK